MSKDKYCEGIELLSKGIAKSSLALICNGLDKPSKEKKGKSAEQPGVVPQRQGIA